MTRFLLIAPIVAVSMAIAGGALYAHKVVRPAQDVEAPPTPNPKLPDLADLAQTGPVADTEWSDLLPPNWAPARTFGDDVARLNDDDPRAMDALVKLREAWANAPAEPAMDGRRIRIGGYIVPLDSERGAVTEFLLVPYFGACIHAPPPPANQAIHVIPQHPVSGITMLEPVLVSGTLRLARDRSQASAAELTDAIGYAMRAQTVVPYEAKR